MVLEAQFLLYTLNEYLSHTAVLVQPLQAGPDWTEDAPLYSSVDIPLPVSPSNPASLTGAGPHALWSCLCTIVHAGLAGACKAMLGVDGADV